MFLHPQMNDEAAQPEASAWQEDAFTDASSNPPPLLNVDDLHGEVSEDALTITLLKQYIYCPRVVYYETCTPGLRPRTYKMEAGEDAHERERERAARRSLFAYQIPEGERRFDVRFHSQRLNLTGIVDEVVLMQESALVVDYKLAEWVGENHELQLTAYALLAEEWFGRPVTDGYIYLLKSRQFENVPITGALRNSVLETAQAVQHIRRTEYMPPPVNQPRKCATCEFRRLCVDI